MKDFVPFAVAGRSQLQRGTWLLVLLSALILTVASASHADSTVPVALQAKLIARVVPYDRNFAKKASGSVGVLIAVKAGDAESANSGNRFRKALEDIGSIGKLPVSTTLTTYSNASGLASEAKKSGALVVYLAPGLGGEVTAIAGQLAGSGILSASANESDVAKGAVFGVALQNGKPRMGINLAQARAQKLDFPAALLKLAKVY